MKKNNLTGYRKGFFNLFLFLFILSIQLPVLAKGTGVISYCNDISTDIHTNPPFCLVNNKVALKMECGTQVEILPYFAYYKNKKDTEGQRLDQIKAKKKFSVENKNVVSFSPEGVLIAGKEGNTHVTISYKGAKLKFPVYVVSTDLSKREIVTEYKKLISQFNKGIQSKASFTKKNRVKKLKILHQIKLVQEKMAKEEGEDQTRLNAMKGIFFDVAVIPDFYKFERNRSLFNEYCSDLDPTNRDCKYQKFKPMVTSYDGKKVTIHLARPITEDQLFGFRSNSSEAYANYIDWKYGNYTGTGNKIKKAKIVLQFYNDNDNAKDLKQYQLRGTVKIGDDKIVLTPYVASSSSANYKKKKLKSGTYRFIFYKDPSKIQPQYWLRKMKFTVE